jgi:HPt (histidine-containing phosphotransfer) domain-containing protein
MPFIDKDRMQEEYGDDLDILSDAIDAFLATYENVIAKIKSAVLQQQSVSVADHAHELKGMVAVFGFGEMYEACKKLEECGRQGQIAEFKPIMEKIVGDIDGFVAELSDYQRSLSA